MATQTQKGMLKLICTVLDLYSAGRGERSSEAEIINAPDCKLALNDLIRHYGTFFVHPEPNGWSDEARLETDPKMRTLDHVIPVAVLMEILMRRATTRAGVTPEFLVPYLAKYLITCRITKRQDSMLKMKAVGLGERMPGGSIDDQDDFPDPWIRYKQGVYSIPYQLTNPWERKTKSGKIKQLVRPDFFC